MLPSGEQGVRIARLLFHKAMEGEFQTHKAKRQSHFQLQRLNVGGLNLEYE